MVLASARIDLRNVREYLDEIHDALEERVADFQKRVDADARRLDQEAREQWYDWNSDTYWRLSAVFPSTLRHSVFVTSYSLLEHTLLRFCTMLAHRAPKGLDLSDLRGEGIGLAKTYLKKVQGIAFPDQSREWNRLSYYRKIRNCLVHNDGLVPKRGDDIRTFAGANPDLVRIADHSRLSLSRKACEDILSVTDAFLNLIVDGFRKAKKK